MTTNRWPRCRLLGVLVLLTLAASLPARSADDRQRLASERAAAEARYAARIEECRKRFVVTACVDEAKRERREVEARLRQQRNVLDDVQRKSQADARQRAIDQKQQEATARTRPSERSSPAAPERPKSHAAERAASGSETKPEPRRPQPRPSHVKVAPAGEQRSAEEEARSREALESAQRQAAARRAEVERRNAERASRRKPATALPVPSAPSAP
jgi:colicin import membrane protein